MDLEVYSFYIAEIQEHCFVKNNIIIVIINWQILKSELHNLSWQIRLFKQYHWNDFIHHFQSILQKVFL